jgi:hypothetical protein
MAAYDRALIDRFQHSDVLGGCCGTTPYRGDLQGYPTGQAWPLLERARNYRESGCGLSGSEVSIIFMGLAKRVITPWGVVVFTAMAILTYILWQGPERFYYESFGTWIVSPGIYVRLLPSPLNEWLLRALRHIPLLASALHLAPVALLALSFALSLYSIWNKTILHAFISLALATAVFSAYHFLQPFGITLIHY